MSKATNTKLTVEEETYLAELALKEASQTKPMPMMKQLAINEDKVNDKGEKIDADTWTIRGENVYSDSVAFQPLSYVHKFIRMSQDGKKWKIDNESVFVPMPWDKAYDANGTMGCGRIVGKTPDNWTEAHKLANFKKATIYGFLFGLVTFPGKQPELVNFRAAPAKAKVIREALATIGDDYKMFHVPFKLKVTAVKGEKFPLITMDADLSKANKSFGSLIPYIKEVDSFIEAHNARIMERRKQFTDRVAGAVTYESVKSLASDFDTEIPFGGEVQY